MKSCGARFGGQEKVICPLETLHYNSGLFFKKDDEILLDCSRSCIWITGSMHESESCSVVSNSLPPHGLYSPWNSPGQNTGVGRLSLLQGIFLTQGLNRSLLHYRQILYQLSYQGSPKVLEFDIKSEKIYFLKCLEG